MKEKPCPFCGNRTPKAQKQGSVFYVICGYCAAEGPIEDTEAEAVASWNTRKEPPK